MSAVNKNSRKRSPRAKRRNSKSAPKRDYGKIVTFVILLLIFAAVLNTIDNIVFNVAFKAISHTPTKGDFAGNLIYDAINLHHSIQENPNNRAQLLDHLAEPVTWYGKRERFHKDLKFGSEYDKFAFIDELQFDVQEFKENNYEVRFHGMYRFRHPKDALVAFESGLAIIERGKITVLKSNKVPNAYKHEWINNLYKWYLIATFFAGFIIALLITSFSEVPDNIRQALWRGLQKAIGL